MKDLNRSKRIKKYDGDLLWQYDRPKRFWREDGARSLAHRFWAGYCDFLCMLNGFESLKLFIDRYKEITPEWSADLEEAGAVRTASPIIQVNYGSM